jgi:hypothetical protein
MNTCRKKISWNLWLGKNKSLFKFTQITYSMIIPKSSHIFRQAQYDTARSQSVEDFALPKQKI